MAEGKKSYSEKLKDFRWIDKRSKIIERDNNCCQRCRSEEELEVHHIHYAGEPWEAKDIELITLCEYCHKTIEHIKEQGYNMSRDEIMLKTKFDIPVYF